MTLARWSTTSLCQSKTASEQAD